MKTDLLTPNIFPTLLAVLSVFIEFLKTIFSALKESGRNHERVQEFCYSKRVSQDALKDLVKVKTWW
ncbi:MAG: hypothetical protein EOM32_09595 [Spirochaetia bacterium]|nr:hypothetical protein [Spirochaetia bacterium]NCC90695.1 hypothetical protein [Spirochaetia bacterium]